MIFKRLKPVLVIGFNTFLLISCGKSKDSVRSFEYRAPVNGSILKSVNEVLNDEYAGLCDQKQAVMRRKIAAILDVKQAEIKAFALQETGQSEFQKVALGPTVISKRVYFPPKNSEWKTIAESWDEVFQNYLEIKDNPLSIAWVSLDADVRSLANNDEERVLAGVNPYLHHDSGEKILALKTFIEQCHEGCNFAKMDISLLEFMRRQPFYNDYSHQIDAEVEVKNKVAVQERFLKRLNADLEHYSVSKNDGVMSVNSNEFWVSLDAGVFESARDQLASYIESVWKSDELKVKVKWVNSSSDSTAFRFLLGDAPYARSYVSLHEKVVKLFPMVEAGAIAHEIGHVLGFSDHYYTVWNADTCSYLTEYNEVDIMSDPTQASVLPEEWAALKKTYF